MSLRKRADVWIADMRADGGPRLSLRTTDRDTARVLHNEVEQLLLKGEPVNNQVITALLASYGAMQRTTASTLPSTTAVPVMRPSASVSLRQAFQLAKQRRDDWRTSRSASTIDANFEHVAKHYGHERPLGSIGSGDTAAYRALLLAQGKSASTINQRTSLLSVLFDEMANLHDETGEPRYAMTKPRMRRVKVAPPRFRILSATEEATVLAWFKDNNLPEMADLTGALLDTGFRLSEMLAVDPASPWYVDQAAGMVWARDTKSGHDRCVPMTQRVIDIFTRHSQTGFRALTVDRADHLWDRMRKGIGLAADRQFVIHALRHTCCTRMVVAGYDSFRVMTWMGHRNISTTQLYVTLFGANLTALKGAHERVTAAAIGTVAQSQVEQESPIKSAGTIPQTELIR